MRKRTITLATWLVYLLTGLALGAEFSVTGTGVVWTEPDQAVLDLGYSDVAADVAGAVAQGDAAVLAIRAALAALGIDPLDVRTTGYAIWREEHWDDAGEPRLVGYRVHHALQVLLRDVELVGDVVVAATEAGANQIGGIGFAVSDTRALETEARAAAFAEARARADEFAALAGVSIGRVARVEELERSVAYPAAYAMDGKGGDAPVAAGRHAVEVIVRVTFASDE